MTEAVMRSFLIDEIFPEDMRRLEDWLRERGLQSIEHLYHFPLPPDLLSATQREHAPACGPFYMALESGPDRIRLELLVRAGRSLHCECAAYATPEQELHMRTCLENLLSELGIRV